MSHTITPSGRSVNPWWIGITVTIATFMELLDTSIANVSLPHIAGGLGTESGRFRGVWKLRLMRAVTGKAAWFVIYTHSTGASL